MSPLTQSIVVGGSIFAVIMLMQFGRRKYGKTVALRSLLIVGVFGALYLPAMPLDNGMEAAVYAAAIGLGVLFGLGACAVSSIERSADGTIYTRTGVAFAAVWGGAVLIRIVAIWAITDVASVRNQFGVFMISHQISFDAIAPFFVLWALTMVLTRLVVVEFRRRALITRANPARDELATV